MVIDQVLYSGRNYCFRHFQFAMAIRTGQYASFNMISFNIYVIKLVNRDKGTLLLPEAGHAYLIVAALHWFSLTSQRSYCGRNVSCLRTTESHLEHNASLLLQLHKLLQENVSSFSQKICITYSCASHGLITRSWLHIIHWDRSQSNPVILFLLPSAFDKWLCLHFG